MPSRNFYPGPSVNGCTGSLAGFPGVNFDSKLLTPNFSNFVAPASRRLSGGRPARPSGRPEAGATQIFSAARIFALRERGLRSISSSPAVTGFFVSNL